MDEEDVKFNKILYVDQSTLFFKFLIKIHQWSGVTESQYLQWCNNFNQFEEGKYIAIRILNSMLYYSERDILKMLECAFDSIFSQEIVLPLQKANQKGCCFSQLPSVLDYEVNQAVSKTIVIPLINEFLEPGTSGPQIVRYIESHIRPRFSTIFHFNLLPDIQCDRLIIVDDCIGSGNQISNFWNDAHIKDGTLLKDWAVANNKKVFYLALVGYKKTLEELKESLNGIQIVCVDTIDDRHQIFSDASKCWLNKEEKEWAYSVLQRKMNDMGLPVKGFDDLTFAVAFHQTIPDWTLPALYKNRNGWNHFLERKDTYD